MQADFLSYNVYLEMYYHGRWRYLHYGDGNVNHTVTIDVSKQASQGQFTCGIDVYNADLSDATIFTRMPETIGKTISVNVVLGRGEHISSVFTGQVASSYVKDFPTEHFVIEAVGFNLYSGVITMHCKKQINTNLDIKKEFARRLGLGCISYCQGDEKKLEKDFNYNGIYPMRALKEHFYNERIYVEGGILKFMDIEPTQQELNKIKKGRIMVLNERTGIEGTIQPSSLTQIQFSHLLIPEIQLGQQVNLNCISDINKQYNGTWFCCGLSHSGTFGKNANANTNLTLGKVSVC